MALTDKDYVALAKIQEFERTVPGDEWPLGWEWSQVGVYAGTINKLLVEGLVQQTYKSNASKCYKLTDKGKSIVPVAEEAPEGYIEPVNPQVDLNDLFNEVVGYDELKELLRESLQLDKPLHILLHGPPSIAKTLFLIDIERACGASSMWVLGSGASRAGIWEELTTRRPKVLLIDELEKMAAVDHAGLLSLLEKGRIVRMKSGKKFDEQMDVWVFATANRISRLSPELLSRFAKYHLGEYSASEYMKVVRNVLTSREGLDEDSAAEIATRLVGKTHDVRDALRVANLSKRVGVKRAVELLIR